MFPYAPLSNRLAHHKYSINKDFSLLKMAAIYGANGSGKSNFVKGLSFLKQLDADRLNQCKTWKRVVDKLGNSGFDSDYHPTLLVKAIQNAGSNYENEGYFPKVGSTQVYKLGEEIYKLVKDVLSDFE